LDSQQIGTRRFFTKKAQADMQKRTVISFLLACATVLGGMVLMDRSILKFPVPRLDTATGTTDQPSRPPINPAAKQRPMTSHNAQPDAIAQPGKVTKCIVSGKILYSNEACPKGAKVQAVQLHDTAGVVSPPKEELADLTARRIASEQVYSQRSPQQVSVLESSKKAECDELSKYIEWLDDMARQPQSGQMQDWIKERKAATQSRQYALHC
jgi:hypothetical protein